jgi:hypothetical protein
MPKGSVRAIMALMIVGVGMYKWAMGSLTFEEMAFVAAAGGLYTYLKKGQ